jgi:hypothetical protein
MNLLEHSLLAEIKKRLGLITEAVDDFSFAIIKARTPSDIEHAASETIVTVTGFKRGLARGSIGNRLKLDDKGNYIPCPLCNDKNRVDLGSAIRPRIDEYNKYLNKFEGKEGQSKNVKNKIKIIKDEIKHLKEKLTRFEESGRDKEEIQCPFPGCQGWEWHDIDKYKDPTTGKYSERIAKKSPYPWTILVDWLWDIFEKEGLMPTQAVRYGDSPKSAGFKSSKDKYGANIPSAGKSKKPIPPLREIVINIESIGNTDAQVHRNLAQILKRNQESLPYFEVKPWPSRKLADKLDIEMSKEIGKRTSDERIEELERIEEGIRDSRGFYVSGKIEEPRFGEELGLEPFEFNPGEGLPADISELLMAIKEPKRKMQPVAGMPPAREGEWGKTIKAAKSFSGERRRERSRQAHKTYGSNIEKIVDLISNAELKGIKDKERIINGVTEIMADERNAKPGTEGYDRLRKMVGKTYNEYQKEKREKEIARTIAPYPGAKYRYWDDLIAFKAEESGMEPVALEILIDKYMEGIGFQEPFDFDRLSEYDASRALSILDALSPEDINPEIKEEANRYIENIVSESFNNNDFDDLAETLVIDLGSHRANLLFCELRRIDSKSLEADQKFESLIKISLPITKILQAAPICESLDSTKPEFWAMLLCGTKPMGSPTAQINAVRIRDAYLSKMPKWSINSFKKLAEAADKENSKEISAAIAAAWNAVATGRPMSPKQYSVVSALAKRYGAEELISADL